MSENPHRDKLVEEIGSLSVLKDAPGMMLAINELGRRAHYARRTVPLNEPNWELKTAHGQGYTDALDDFKVWLSGRVLGHVDAEGSPHLAQSELSERKRKAE